MRPPFTRPSGGLRAGGTSSTAAAAQPLWAASPVARGARPLRPAPCVAITQPRPPAGVPAAPRCPTAPVAAAHDAAARSRPCSDSSGSPRPCPLLTCTARMSGFYDLMLLIDPTAPEERRTAVVSETESMINSGGELVTNHDWGTRRMAYEIDHRPEAEYRLYQFNGDNDAARAAEPAPADHRRRAALPHHQGQARPADTPAAGSAGPASPRRPRAPGHPGGRPRRRRRARRGRGAGRRSPGRTLPRPTRLLSQWPRHRRPRHRPPRRRPARHLRPRLRSRTRRRWRRRPPTLRRPPKTPSSAPGPLAT